WAEAEGKNFEERYMRLLRDTGAMPVEELAKRHLGVDLKKPEFWRRAVALALEDTEEFLALTGPQETGSPGAGARRAVRVVVVGAGAAGFDSATAHPERGRDGTLGDGSEHNWR